SGSAPSSRRRRNSARPWPNPTRPGPSQPSPSPGGSSPAPSAANRPRGPLTIVSNPRPRRSNFNCPFTVRLKNSARARVWADWLPPVNKRRFRQAVRAPLLSVQFADAGMTSGVPWEVTVGPQARESAREAARRSGMSVGEWLDSLILERARNEGAATDRRPFADSDRRSEPPSRFYGGEGRPPPVSHQHFP